ncbi:hypothetical protein QAD02_020293 [Eretmocerus hayati]|uniref:Uncharacterized protein n=1 Tax=Eretmocerus hayati TaxID=131215 RepID=A0ACC2PLZ5_9HYME|nr:hypothetical protein QAD02_020293 [Eretmocerus hayati]
MTIDSEYFDFIEVLSGSEASFCDTEASDSEKTSNDEYLPETKSSSSKKIPVKKEQKRIKKCTVKKNLRCAVKKSSKKKRSGKSVSDHRKKKSCNKSRKEVSNGKNFTSCGQKSEVKDVSWDSGKENMYLNNVPAFKGKHAVNLQGTTPFEYFQGLFSARNYRADLQRK